MNWVRRGDIGPQPTPYANAPHAPSAQRLSSTIKLSRAYEKLNFNQGPRSVGSSALFGLFGSATMRVVGDGVAACGNGANGGNIKQAKAQEGVDRRNREGAQVMETYVPGAGAGY